MIRFTLALCTLIAATTTWAADQRDTTNIQRQQPVVTPKTQIPKMTLEQRVAQLEKQLRDLRAVYQVLPGGNAAIVVPSNLGITSDSLAIQSASDINVSAQQTASISADDDLILSSDKDAIVTAGKDLSLTSVTDMNLGSTGGESSIGADKGVTIESNKDLTIQADGKIDIKAKGQLVTKGSATSRN